MWALRWGHALMPSACADAACILLLLQAPARPSSPRAGAAVRRPCSPLGPSPLPSPTRFSDYLPADPAVRRVASRPGSSYSKWPDRSAQLWRAGGGSQPGSPGRPATAGARPYQHTDGPVVHWEGDNAADCGALHSRLLQTQQRLAQQVGAGALLCGARGGAVLPGPALPCLWPGCTAEFMQADACAGVG